MTEFAKEQMAEKIAQCAEALVDLKRYRETGTVEYFRSHPDVYHATCFRFIGAIESLFDIGQYVLTSRNQRADSQREVATLLARENIVSDDLASRFANMYGFRNRLVHAYGTLEDAKVAEYLADHLSDVEELLTVFQKVNY